MCICVHYFLDYGVKQFYLGKIDTQRIVHIECGQFDEFGHMQTPMTPSPQPR